LKRNLLVCFTWRWIWRKVFIYFFKRFKDKITWIWCWSLYNL